MKIDGDETQSWATSSNSALQKYQLNLGNSSDASASPKRETSDLDSDAVEAGQVADAVTDHNRAVSMSLSPIAGPSRILRSRSGAIISYDPSEVISLSSGGELV